MKHRKTPAAADGTRRTPRRAICRWLGHNPVLVERVTRVPVSPPFRIGYVISIATGEQHPLFARSTTERHDRVVVCRRCNLRVGD